MPPVGTLASPRIDDQQIRDDGLRRFRVVATYTGPALYATGGDPVLPTDVSALMVVLTGVSVLDDVLVSNPFFNGTNIFELSYNTTSNTLQCFDPSTKAEVAANTNLSTYTVRIEFVCH